jgi:hypothetical protein
MDESARIDDVRTEPTGEFSLAARFDVVGLLQNHLTM